MNRTSIPWRYLVFFVLYVLASLLFYDFYTNKSYQKTKTYQILSDSGAQFYVEQIYNKVTVYWNKAYGWLEVNLPYYFEKTGDAVGPYLQLFWEKLYDFGIYLGEVSKPARMWLNEKTPLVLEWLDEKYPIVWNAVSSYSSKALKFLINLLVLMWQHLVYYLNIIGTWLVENVFVGRLAPENILRALSEIPALIQTYMASLAQWLYSLTSKINGDLTVASKED